MLLRTDSRQPPDLHGHGSQNNSKVEKLHDNNRGGGQLQRVLSRRPRKRETYLCRSPVRLATRTLRQPLSEFPLTACATVAPDRSSSTGRPVAPFDSICPRASQLPQGRNGPANCRVEFWVGFVGSRRQRSAKDVNGRENDGFFGRTSSGVSLAGSADPRWWLRYPAAAALTSPSPSHSHLSKPAASPILTFAYAAAPWRLAGRFNYRILMVQRSHKLRAFANLFAFPGGVEDSADAVLAGVGQQRSEAQDSQATSLKPPRLRTLALTAARECFEETGLLPWAAPVDGPAAGEGSLGQRDAVREQASAFQPVMECTGVPRSAEERGPWLGETLIPMGRFITPTFEKRRYDTAFFLSTVDEDSLPAGVAEEDGSETTSLLWLTPEEALAGHANGKFRMLPPQW